MKNYKIIIELEANNSRLFKESILLREMNAENDIFFEGLKFACNKLITFGVKKIPELKIDGPGIIWLDFKKLLIDLNNRELTGNAAKEAIQSLMEKSSANEWNFFFRRILIKDLRCGLSEKTINNVAKKNNFLKYQIPVFNCQLAQDSDQQQKKMNGSKILEVKLDGVRVISILYKSGKVDMFSRNGKELLNFENVKEQLLNTLKKKNINESIVLDGEIVSKNFQELMKQIYRKDSVQNNDATLFLFDYLTLQEFKNGISNIVQSERILKLKKWYSSNKEYVSNIKLLESNIVNLDTNEGRTKFKDFNNHAVLEGYEGIMIKDPNSIYEAKRSSSWLKSKPVIEVSLIVKSLEEGTGKNKGRLGAIFATGNDGGKNFRLSVGSGFSDIQRESFWQEKNKLLGQIIEIKADAITKSKDSKYWSLRFPRFKTFRGFNEGEKI